MRPVGGLLPAATAAWLGLAVAILLAGCASTPIAGPGASLFNDQLFLPQSERIDAADVFAPSPQMLAYIQSDIAPEQRARGRQQGLFDALYRKGALQLDYDATITRNAAEAFAARTGNCLSLVLMTAAFARQLGLVVRYQSVYTKASWSRGERLDYLNGHVNLVLGFDPKPNPGGVVDRNELLIDFMAVPAGEVRRIRVLAEPTVVAMYMNNRAVELLSQGELDRAYWWTKAAIAQDGQYLAATNTLAVIYRAKGQSDLAARALRRILDVEPDNIVAMDNLVRVLETQGRSAEAGALSARLQQLRPIPPFHYFDLGLEALRRQDFAKAKSMFLQEMRRDAIYDKFHASLALAYYGLGDLDNAQKQMAIAVGNSTTTADRALYAEELARLKAGQHP